jgi:hypothetical protein
VFRVSLIKNGSHRPGCISLSVAFTSLLACISEVSKVIIGGKEKSTSGLSLIIKKSSLAIHCYCYKASKTTTTENCYIEGPTTVCGYSLDEGDWIMPVTQNLKVHEDEAVSWTIVTTFVVG